MKSEQYFKKIIEYACDLIYDAKENNVPQIELDMKNLVKLQKKINKEGLEYE